MKIHALSTLFLLQIYLSNAATYLYGLQWKWFAYTTGNEDGMKYVSAGASETYTMSSSATSIRFKNAGEATIEIYNTDNCWTGTSFNIDTMLKCKGSTGAGWAGLYYKSGNDGPNDASWDHWRYEH